MKSEKINANNMIMNARAGKKGEIPRELDDSLWRGDMNKRRT